jgi:hypothetical protein
MTSFIACILKREEKARKRREDMRGLECCKGESPVSGCLWGSFSRGSVTAVAVLKKFMTFRMIVLPPSSALRNEPRKD